MLLQIEQLDHNLTRQHSPRGETFTARSTPNEMSTSTTNAPPRLVYVLGIKPDIPQATWDQIHATVTADLARAGRNGFPCTLQAVDPQDVEGSIAHFEAQLRELTEAGKLGAVLFGAGIRGKKDVVPFERALGVIARVLGGKGGEGVKMLLNDGPDRHCWAIERGFGVRMEIE